jgi:hypothetical protein
MTWECDGWDHDGVMQKVLSIKSLRVCKMLLTSGLGGGCLSALIGARQEAFPTGVNSYNKSYGSQLVV